MTAIVEHAVEIHGCRLHFLRAGAGPRTVLLVHGLGDDRTAFPARVVRELAGHHTVLAPDLAGFGQSRARPGFDFRLDAQAALLARLLEAAGAPDPVLLIGHSMGGAVATRFAAAHPDRTAALINVEGNLCPGDAFLSTHAVRAAGRGRFDVWWRLLPAAIKRQNGETPAILRYLRALARTTPEAFLASTRDLHAATCSGALGEAYRRLPVRRIYFHGDHAPRDTRALLRAHALDAVAFPGAPHWLIEHDPAAFLEEARRFLTPPPQRHDA